MKNLIRKYPILSFLILNYLISWTFLYPSYQLIIKNDGITPLALIGFIGAYGPTIAALIVQAVLDKSKLIALLKSLIKVKASISVYIFVILLPILLYLVSYIVGAITFGGDLTFTFLNGISGMHFWFLAALPFGPMGEELGWRGFLLPKVLDKFSVLKSTIIVGLAWGIWHFASFTFPGAAIPSFLPVSFLTILLYFFNTIALSMVFTYVHLKSNGSVFLAIILHAFFNAASNIAFDFFPEPETFNLQFIPYVINMILALTVGYLLIKHVQNKDNLKANSVENR
jgi:membrane protease YdiL (CAAX protease family)